MTAQASAQVLRAQNIGEGTSAAQIQGLLKQFCSDREKRDLDIKISLVPSCTVRDGSLSALVKIHPTLPEFLQHVGKFDHQIKFASTVLNLDKSFLGLTQLYPNAHGRAIVADLVAVTGFSGRPFDSWRGKGPYGLMWLKDFLCSDLPSFRTMIYGYDTKWDSKNVADISDFAQDLIKELRKARQSDEEIKRPLILIAHSLGAIVVADALKQCKLATPESFSRKTYSSVCGVLFFGAPHQGLEVEDLVNMATDLGAQERAHLIDLLKKGSQPLQQHLASLTSLAGDFRIVSFYERVLSRKLEKAEEPGKGYARTGEHFEYLTKASSLLHLPSFLEECIPVNADHSSMVKFDHQSDSIYQDILLRLRNIETTLPNYGFKFVKERLEDKGTSDSSELSLSTRYLEARLVELAGLYAQLSFDTSADQLNTFAVLRIEFQIGCQRAKFCIELLRQRLSSAQGEPESENHSTFLTKYRLVLDQSIFTMRKLVGWGPVLIVSERIEDVKVSLASCAKDLSILNLAAAALISPNSEPLFTAPGHENKLEPQIRTIANMAIARGSNLTQDLNALWVDSTTLFFGEFPEPRSSLPSWSVIQRLAELWSRNEVKTRQGIPRQYGVLKMDGVLEEIMAEFRPYQQDLKSSDPDEYRRQRLQVSQLGQMLLSSRNLEGSNSFPCLQFRCLSELASPDSPAFMLIFSSRGVRSLGEIIHQRHLDGSRPPPRAIRQRLALNLAKAVLALHLSGQVHGAIYPENIFFKFDTAGDDSINNSEPLTTPLLAGFEIARDMTGQSSLVDVEDPHLRIYLHPQRQLLSMQKSKQAPRFDIFSLGMVLIEIGIWQRFQNLQKYQEQRGDRERQLFARRLRKSFSQSLPNDELSMGHLYETAVSKCLNDKSNLSELESNSIPDESSIFLGSPNGMEIVAMLEEQLR